LCSYCCSASAAFAQTAPKESGRAMTASGATCQPIARARRSHACGKILLASAPVCVPPASLHAHRSRQIFYLLSVTGPKMPADAKKKACRSPSLQKRCNQLAQALARRRQQPIWRSREDLQRKVHIEESRCHLWTACTCASSSTQRAHGPARRLRPHVRRRPPWSKKE